MKFTKMHGIGNDYVYVNGIKERILDKPAMARFVSDRHTGIGSDGLIIINDSDVADFEMEMYNSDGSRAEMCGNGIRCVGKYVYDYGLTKKTELAIETLGGIKYLKLALDGNKVSSVQVDMGAPILKPEDIPVVSDMEPVLMEELVVDGKTYRMNCVSMGNPHAVIFMDEDVSKLPLEEMGPGFENHERFPKRINTEFARVLDRKNIEMRVWERGAGETMACGTGACATAVAAILNNLVDEEVTIHLRGGDLLIHWDREENKVFMTGTATTVFQGELITDKELLFLEPVFKQMIWGGERLRDVFGYDIPGNDTGECWAISAHQNGDGKIAGGTYAGRYLSELWKEEKHLFGDAKGEVFPLLVKLIDAKADLSIQVHPDDAYAKVNENGSLGKTECWYIVDCDEDATIVIGHNAASRQELRDMVEEKRWSELIREIPIKKGDFFQIEPGTLHAIKGGTMILETQQSSDITYRVYDYDRLSNGQPRPLHKEQSLEVINCPHVDVECRKEKEVYEGYEREVLVDCDMYEVEHIVVKSEAKFDEEKPFALVSVLDGEGFLNDTPIAKGQHFIIPAGFGDYEMKGQLEIIKSRV